MAWLVMSSTRVVTDAAAVGAPAGCETAGMAGILVGKDETVGSKTCSVARAIGEQAANPPSTPKAPIFNASLREIFLFMITPPNSEEINNLSISGLQKTKAAAS